VFSSLALIDVLHLEAFVEQIARHVEGNEDLKNLLFINFKKKKSISAPEGRVSQVSIDQRVFIDQTVYQNNQNFRFYLSRKYGKENFLFPYPRCKFASYDAALEFFLKTVVTHLPNRESMKAISIEDSSVSAVTKPRAAVQSQLQKGEFRSPNPLSSRGSLVSNQSHVSLLNAMFLKSIPSCSFRHGPSSMRS
jgi:hypothetical protein